jgi:hypothetical protein
VASPGAFGWSEAYVASPRSFSADGLQIVDVGC